LAKASAGDLIGDSARIEDFDGNFAVKVCGVCAVNRAHSSAANPLDNAVVVELESNQRVMDEGFTRQWKLSFPVNL
jgi:hypothetical protein